MSEKTPRQKAIIRRRIFISCCIAVLVVAIVAVSLAISAISKAIKGTDKDSSSSDILSSGNISASSDVDSSEDSSSASEPVESGPDYVTRGEYTLDANYTNLLLVNGKNPLPEDFDYEGNLTTIEDKYINGSLKQIDKDVWPYMRAMIEAAWADNVKLYVWSPYRSYSTQNMLYENQVKRCMNKGLDRAAAEIEAATVVARPGTSEHHTGLAADFNMASDAFENTEMFRWMQENAEDYGFIMRYYEEKTEITGVIHESWHYRFVGINVAIEMNDLNMCLEEYVEYKNK